MEKMGHNFLRIVVFGIIYGGTGVLALKFQKYGGVTPIWPPSGIALALILVWGRRVWPGIVIGIFLEAWYMGFNLAPVLTILPGNILEPLAGAWMIDHFCDEGCFNSVGNALKFIRIAFVAPLFSSIPAVLGLLLLGKTHFPETSSLWFTWWMGNLAGIFIFTPLIIVWKKWPNYQINPGNVFLGALFLMINAFVFFFVPQNLMNDRVTLTYLTVTFVIWISVRYGFHGATIATFLVAVFAMAAAYMGIGPFSAKQVLLEVFLQVSFLTVTASSGIIIAAVIQESHFANKALKENERRLRTLINSTPDIICFKDGQGRWLETNRANLELFQLTGMDYTGKTDSELASLSPFYSDALTGCEATDESAWQHAELSRGEEVIPRPDGPPKIYDVIKVPLFDDKKRKGLVVLGRDITERKAAEKKLNRYNERLIIAVEQKTREMESLTEKLLRQEKLATVGKVSGSIAHELRNPLGAIKQSVFFLKRKLAQAPPKVAEHLTLIEDEINISETVIQNLLEITRIKPIKKEPFNIRAIVEKAIDSLSVPSGIVLKNDIPDHIVLTADPIQIRQVFSNLIQNAIQSIDKDGQVTIDARVDKNLVKISVTDTGQGIPIDCTTLCFEPLYTTKAKGTGLGLAICKETIERHLGQISLVSTEGKGTSLHICLPIGA